MSKDDDAYKQLRSIADAVADYRRDYIQQLFDLVVEDCEKIAETGYDPSKGSGRGAWWAEGD